MFKLIIYQPIIGSICIKYKDAGKAVKIENFQNARWVINYGLTEIYHKIMRPEQYKCVVR